MKRRTFFGTAAAAGLTVGLNPTQSTARARLPSDLPKEPLLAGLSLTALREKYRRELFEEYVPFFIKYGIDFENGGFMCSLDHDGRLVKTNKFGWFQGRGIWWFSYLYNHFEKKDQYLEIAAKTKDFMLRHFPDEPGSVRWANDVAKDGSVIVPYKDDPFPCYFGIEGMFELASATGDMKLRDEGLKLFKKQVAYVRRPDTPFLGNPPGTQGFNLYMVNLQLATRFLSEWNDPEVEKIAADAVDVIMNRFYNPRIKLFNELLNNDFSRKEGWENHAYMGHGVEVMWLVCHEAIRTKNQALFDLAAQRMLDHLETSWDRIFGGFATAIRVDQGDYKWPTIKPAGSMLAFDGIGEFNYMKSLWQLAEGLIGAMTVYERTGAEWSARFVSNIQQTLDEKMSLKPHGYPLHMLFTDRQFTFEPHTSRKENYHYPRAILYCIKSLDRLILNDGKPLGSVA